MFTRRQSKILELLLNNVQGLTGTKLAEYLEVSSRTVRNEISEINRIWENGNIIKSSRQRGYFIETIDIESVKDYFLSEKHGRSEIAVSDRGWMILGMVLKTGQVDIFDIGDKLALSEPAVYKEISRFQKKLMSEYQSELIRMSGNRLRINEDEAKLRQTLFRIIKNETQHRVHNYSWFLRTFLYDDFDEEEYGWMEKLVKEYFDSRFIQISDDGLYMAVSAVYITIVRNYQNHPAPAAKTTESGDKVLAGFFDYLTVQGIKLGNGDIRILEGLLHSFKMTSDMSSESEIGTLSVQILEDFCHDVMEKYHFDLWQSKEFYDNILIHIEYMMRRLETGYEVKNPILNDVKKQYPYAYEISMLMASIIYRYKNCYIQDDEISFIAIFVEHFLENVNQKLKAVIISAARFSVNSIVSSWIKTNFQNQIEVETLLPKHNLEKYLKEHRVDLIISIMDTYVHPSVATFRMDGIPNQYTLTAMNALVHRIRMNYRFREMIKVYFNERSIRIYREKTEFEQVIRDLSKELKKEDCIFDVQEFAEDVLQREVNYPTFIGDWFMLPHPLVTFAKKTAIGAAVLKQPLRMQEKEVQLIFLLAMERKHNEQLGVLFELFRHIAGERSAIRRLTAVETAEEFAEELIQISASLEIYKG